MKVVIGILAAAALCGAIVLWVGDGSGGDTNVSTHSGPGTTSTFTTNGTVTAIASQGTATTVTQAGHPSRSSESAVEIFLVGMFVVLGLGAVSKGPIKLTFPGGGGFEVGTTAQAQVSGALASRYTNPDEAKNAYEQAIALLNNQRSSHVSALGKDELDSLVQDVVRTVPPSNPGGQH